MCTAMFLMFLLGFQYKYLSIIKVCVKQKLLLTSFQCSDVFPAEMEYWIVLFLRTSSVSHSLRGVFKDVLPKQSNWRHQRRNAIPERKLMFRFWLKITKTNNCFERINLYRLFVHIKTMCNSKVNSQFWFNADFKSRFIQFKDMKLHFLRNWEKQKQMSVNGVCENCFPFELGWFLLLADIWYLIQKFTLFWYISLKSKLFIVSF